jgi:hypothetical protein
MDTSWLLPFHHFSAHYTVQISVVLTTNETRPHAFHRSPSNDESYGFRTDVASGRRHVVQCNENIASRLLLKFHAETLRLSDSLFGTDGSWLCTIIYSASGFLYTAVSDIRRTLVLCTAMVCINVINSRCVSVNWLLVVYRK